MVTRPPKKLKTTIMAYFILANIAISLVAFGSAAYNFYWHIRDASLESLRSEAANQAATIGEWLRLTIMSVGQYSRLESGRRHLEDYYQGHLDRKSLARESEAIFSGLAGLAPDLKGLTRLDRGGHPLFSLGRALEARPSLPENQTKPVLSLLPEGPEAPPLLLLSWPIMNRLGERLGQDLFSLDTASLTRLIGRSHNAAFPIQVYLIAQEAPPRGDVLVLSRPHRPDFSLPPEIQRLMDRARDDPRPALTLSQDGLACGVSRVEATNWRLIVTADEAELYAPVTEQLKRTTRLFLLFFTIAILGLWFLALNPLTFEVDKTTGALEYEVEETAGRLRQEAEGRKKTESRLAVATHQATMARQAKKQFLANLSHEIRTPLNAVIGMTDLTLLTELSTEQHAYLLEVKKAAAVLLEQINDLLELSKLEDGLMFTENRKFNLCDFLDRLVQVYASAGCEKNLGFSWQLDENLEFWRWGDALRLRQVLNCLLDNAFKFTAAGGVELSIRQAEGEAGRLEFLVRDSGIGIPADRLESIFDPFTQADTSLTRDTGGSGLGLAITKRLVELMGAVITVASEPGRGSLFTVTLDLPPVSEADQTPEKPAETPPAAEEPAGRPAVPAEASADWKKAAGQLTKTENPRKILVVDDNPLNQKLAVTLLTKRGHSAAVASNGREALEAIAGGGFDVVLMDIQMPVMDGLTAVRQIRAEPEKYGPGLPVVAMTAHALPGDQETFLDAGMTGYVSKPFKPHDLIDAVEQRFSRRDQPGDNGGKSVALELNRAAILENFMDDEELLFESIDLFLERISARMAELKKAVAEKNPETFMPEAHTIKGMIGIFSTAGAFEAAKKLEMKGREKVTAGVDEDFQALENEVELLVSALRAWRSA